MGNCVKLGNVAKSSLGKTRRGCVFVLSQVGHRHVDILSLCLSLIQATRADSTAEIFCGHISKEPTAKGLVLSLPQTPKAWSRKTYKKHFSFRGRISLQLRGRTYHVCESTVKEKSAIPTSLHRSTLKQL